MRERIVEFIEKEGISAADFADNIGVQRSSVSHVLNGRNNPGFSFIQKILETYPDLNSRWLLTGKGTMHEEKISSEASIVSQAITERDLFSTTLNHKTPLLKKPDKLHTKPVHQANSMDEKEQKTIQNEVNSPRKVVRVLIFYDDHTFEDFRPAE